VNEGRISKVQIRDVPGEKEKAKSVNEKKDAKSAK
jgi:hypothetical protein